MAKALSLLPKDSFFEDSFFSDAWEDFDKAVQQVLDTYDTQGWKVDLGSRSKCNDLYRHIRSSKIDDDLYASQALQVTEKDGNFNCVMDVKDFNVNDLKVRTVDDRVVVEGKYEKKSEDGSSMSSKSFYKEFSLPQNADIDRVSTALSKDGVLTIRSPKKEGAASANPSASSSSVQSSSSVVQQSSSSSANTSSSSFSSKKVSSVSSSSSSTFSSSSSAATSGMDKALEDMEKDMKDRLVFSHESVNLKLPKKE